MAVASLIYGAEIFFVGARAAWVTLCVCTETPELNSGCIFLAEVGKFPCTAVFLAEAGKFPCTAVHRLPMAGREGVNLAKCMCNV